MKEFSFENILNQVLVQMVVYDSNFRFLYINSEEEGDALVRNTLQGKTDFDFCEIKSLSPELANVRLTHIKKSIAEKRTIQFEETVEVGGDIKYYQRTITPNFDSNGNLINIIRQGHEITEIKKVIYELEFTANHDSLTGLPNRRHLYFRLSEELKQKTRGDILLFLLDLDRFKTINDTLGHMIGDILIKSVAKRITDLFPENSDCLVSRLGGDEFVVVFFNSKSIGNQRIYAQNILKCFEKPFLLGDHELFITTSIGVYAHSSQDYNTDIDLIIKHADIAMYKAKEAGRNKFKVYTSGMDIKVTSKFSIETKLNQSLRNKDFIIYYQPRIESMSRSVNSVEVLLRWNFNSEVLNTKSFYETLEESGVLLLLSKWIFKTAILENLEWQKTGLGNIPISINLSERQFYDDHLLSSILEILAETGFSSHLLELEISENTIMKNPELSEEILNEIHSKGIRINLDDFGSGYSSLGKLKDYPINTINVGKSLVQGVTENYQDAAVTSAIVSMAHKLNIHVNAEGIETAEQLEFMRYLRCEYFQGYFFSRPLPNSEIRKFIRDKVTQLNVPLEIYSS